MDKRLAVNRDNWNERTPRPRGLSRLRRRGLQEGPHNPERH